MTKQCTKCGDIKKLDEFNWRNKARGTKTSQCKSCACEYRHAHYKKNKEKEKAYQKTYYEANKEQCRRVNKKWIMANPHYFNEWRKKQYATNIQFVIRTRLRAICKWAIKQNSKSAKTMELLGCSCDEFIEYWMPLLERIKAKEQDFLTGKVHIDHIKPCSSFDLTDPQQQATCFHYTNLQPLWAKDNIRKSNKIITN